MRRSLAAIAIIAASLVLWTNPAAASDPYLSPQLIDLGAVSKTNPVAGECVTVPYHVYNAGRFRLQYRGPDGTYRYAERTAQGHDETGKFSLCTKTSWAKGAYWLRSVHFDCEQGTFINVYYDRAAGTVRDCYGDIQMSGLGLNQADFTLH